MANFFEARFERLIATPVAGVWQAWANAASWSAWVQMPITHDFKTGGRWNNGNGEGGLFTEIDPERLLCFTWEMKRYQPGSIVELRLLPNNNSSTICRLHHKNLQCRQDYDNAELGWNWAMDALKCYLETGRSLLYDEWRAGNQ